MPTVTLTPQMRSEYQRLFDTAAIRPEKLAEVNALVDRIVAARPRYEAVGNKLNVPWYFIGIVHCMEGGLSFAKHLHNGDPLTGKTFNVPAGRPKTGNAPFTWEASAEDALVFDKVNQWTDWTIPGLLFKMEGYNGFGYRKLAQPINSPYLWSMTNHYSKGKYIADGAYSPTAVSKQTGAASLLRRMAEKQLVQFGITDRLSLIRQLGASVTYFPSRVVEKAKELQQLLNLAGAHLLVDGKAGKNTSDAYFNLTGEFLIGDPRRR